MFEEITKIVVDVIKQGNSIELKREKENLVVVELKRKARLKIPVDWDSVKKSKGTKS